MNKKQKALSVVCLIIFWVTCLFAPWELTDGSSHFDTIKYSPVFRAPKGGSWQKRRPSVNIAYTWAVLFVSYGMILVLLADPKR